METLRPPKLAELLAAQFGGDPLDQTSSMYKIAPPSDEIAHLLQRHHERGRKRNSPAQLAQDRIAQTALATVSVCLIQERKRSSVVVGSETLGIFLEPYPHVLVAPQALSAQGHSFPARTQRENMRRLTLSAGFLASTYGYQSYALTVKEGSGRGDAHLHRSARFRHLDRGLSEQLAPTVSRIMRGAEHRYFTYDADYAPHDPIFSFSSWLRAALGEIAEKTAQWELVVTSTTPSEGTVTTAVGFRMVEIENDLIDITPQSLES
ncbi:MAG: hypothetical protein AAF909_13820 [Pseudomonadota bacterium]